MDLTENNKQAETKQEKKIGVIPNSIKILVAIFSALIFSTGVLAFMSLSVSKGSEVNLSNAGSGTANYAGGEYPAAASSGGGCGSGSGGGCGSGGGGGCGSGGATKTADQLESIKVEGVKYYVQKYGDKNVDAEVNDRGCHVEIVIIKDNQPVKNLSFNNGQFSEIS